jgi:hypothetical protein
MEIIALPLTGIQTGDTLTIEYKGEEISLN